MIHGRRSRADPAREVRTGYAESLRSSSSDFADGGEHSTELFIASRRRLRSALLDQRRVHGCEKRTYKLLDVAEEPRLELGAPWGSETQLARSALWPSAVPSSFAHASTFSELLAPRNSACSAARERVAMRSALSRRRSSSCAGYEQVSPQIEDTSSTHSVSHLVAQQYESVEQISSVHELQVEWRAAPVEQIACEQVPLMPLAASGLAVGASGSTAIGASIG